MPQLLSEVTLDEISLVDNPANQLAKVVLSKRADKESMSKCGDKPCDKCAAKACDDHMKYDDEDEVKKSPMGVKLNIGFKEEGGSDVQSINFDSSKWTIETSKKWLEVRDMRVDKVEQTEGTLRYHQTDLQNYTKLRTVVLGKEISKALRAKQSFSSLQTAVDAAVRAKFEKPLPGAQQATLYSYLWVRDLFKDTVIFDQDGKTWGADYSASRNDDGVLIVTVGDKVPKEVVYQDVTKVQQVPVNVLSRLAKIEASLSAQ